MYNNNTKYQLNARQSCNNDSRQQTAGNKSPTIKTKQQALLHIPHTTTHACEREWVFRISYCIAICAWLISNFLYGRVAPARQFLSCLINMLTASQSLFMPTYPHACICVLPVCLTVIYMPAMLSRFSSTLHRMPVLHMKTFV